MNAPLPVSDIAHDALDLSSLIVPENYGSVSERHRARNTPHASQTFILVQDSHANYEAQSNISKIIESLVTTSKAVIGAVFVEGGEGRLETGALRSTADAAVREIVARYFLKIGYLSGTEFYGVTAKDAPAPLFGIEERELYYRNLEAFRQAYAARPANQEIIDEVQRALVLVRQKICPPALIDLYVNYEKYAAGTMPFTDFCRYLARVAGDLKIDIAQFQNVALASRAIDLETRISPAKVDAEKEALIKRLTQRAVKEDVANLIQKSLMYRTGRMSAYGFYTYLLETAREKGVIDAASWEQAREGRADTFPPPPCADLLVFYAILNLQTKIDHEKLFDETDMLVAAVKNRLFRSPLESEFDSIVTDVGLSEKLINLRMTRREIDYLRTHPDAAAIGRAVAFVRAQASPLPPEMSARLAQITALDVSAARSFYADALKRDDVFFDQTIRQMTREKLRNAVIVMGGFHKEGIKQKIRAAGYSYAVVTPRITRRYDDTLYASLMLGQKTDLDRFLERIGTRLAPVLRTSPGMDPHGPVELEREFKFSSEKCKELMRKSGRKDLVVELEGGYRAVASINDDGEFSYTVQAVGLEDYGTVVAKMLGVPGVRVSEKGTLDERSREDIQRLSDSELEDLAAKASGTLQAPGGLASRIVRLIEEIRSYAVTVRDERAVRILLKSDPPLNAAAVNALTSLIGDITRSGADDIPSLVARARLYVELDEYLRRHLFDDVMMPSLPRQINQSVLSGLYGPIVKNYEALVASATASGDFDALRDAGLLLEPFNSALSAVIGLHGSTDGAKKEDVERYIALLRRLYRVLDVMLNKLKDLPDAGRIRAAGDIDRIFAEVILLQSQVISLNRLYDADALEAEDFDDLAGSMPAELRAAYREGARYAGRIQELMRVARLSGMHEAELKDLQNAYQAGRGQNRLVDLRSLLRIGALQYYFKNDPAAAIASFREAFELAARYPDILSPALANRLFYYLKEAYYRNFLSNQGAVQQLNTKEKLLKDEMQKLPFWDLAGKKALNGRLKENENERRAREGEIDAFRSELIGINETALGAYKRFLLTDAGVLSELLELQLQIEKNLPLYDAAQLELIRTFENDVLPKTGSADAGARDALDAVTRGLSGSKSGLSEDLSRLLVNIFKAKSEYGRMVDANLRVQLLREYDEKVKQVMRADYEAAERNLAELQAKLDRLFISTDLSDLFAARFAEDTEGLASADLPLKTAPLAREPARTDISSWRMKAAASIGGISVLLDAMAKKIYQFQMRAQERTFTGDEQQYDPRPAVKRVADQGHQVELYVGRDTIRNIKGRALTFNLDVDGLRPYYPEGATAERIIKDFGAIMQDGIAEREKALGRQIYDGLHADRPYTVAVEDKTPGGILFGNHLQDYFIFLSRAVLERLKDNREDRDDFIKVGFSHELRHEAKHRKLPRPLTAQELEDMEAGLTAEDIVLTEALKKKDLPAVVRFLQVLEEQFQPKETGAQYWYGLALRTVLAGAYNAAEGAARLKELLKTVPDNTPLLPGPVFDAYRIVRKFVCSGDAVYGFGADKIDGKPRLILWDFNRAGAGIQPEIVPFKGKTLPAQILSSASITEKVIRARQVAEILGKCSQNGVAVRLDGQTPADFVKGFLLPDKRAPMVFYQYEEGTRVPQDEAARTNLEVFRLVLSEIIRDPGERQKSNFGELTAAANFDQLIRAFDSVSAVAVAMREQAAEEKKKAREAAFLKELDALEGKKPAEIAAQISGDRNKWSLNYRNELAKSLLRLIDTEGRIDLAGAYLVVVPIHAMGDQNLKRLVRQEKLSADALAALREEVVALKAAMGEVETAPEEMTSVPAQPLQLALEPVLPPESGILERAAAAAEAEAPAVSMPDQSLLITERPQGIIGKAMALLKNAAKDFIRMSPIGVAAGTSSAERVELARAVFSVGADGEIEPGKTTADVLQDFGPLAGRFGLVVEEMKKAYERYFSGYIQRSKELEGRISALKKEREDLEADFKRLAIKEKPYQKRKQEVIALTHALEKQSEALLEEYIAVSDKFANRPLVFQVTRSAQLADFTLHADDESAVIAINEKMLKMFERIVQMRDRDQPAEREKLARLEKEFEEGLLFAMRHEFHHYLHPEESELKVDLADIRYYIDLPADRRQYLLGFFSQPEIKPGDFVNILKRAQDKGEIDQEVYGRLQKFLLETISARIERGLLPQLKAVKPLLEKMKKLELDALLAKLCADIGIDDVVNLYETNPQYLFSLLYLKSYQERGPPAAGALKDDDARIEARHGLLVRQYLHELRDAAQKAGDKNLLDALAEVRKVLLAENADPRWDIVAVSRLVSCSVDPHIVIPPALRALGITTAIDLVRAFQGVPRIGQVLRDIEFEYMYTPGQRDVVAKAQGSLTELFHALTLQKETGTPVEKMSTPLRMADGKSDYSEVDFFIGDLIVEVKSRRGGKWEEGNSLQAELAKKLWRFAPAIMDPELGKRTKVLFTVNKAVHDRENIPQILGELRKEFRQWEIVDIRPVPDADLCVGSGDIMESCIAASRKIYRNDLRALGEDAKKKYDAILGAGEKRNTLIVGAMKRAQAEYAEMVSRQLALPKDLVATLVTAFGYDYERIQLARDRYGVETLQGAVKEYISVDRPFWAPDVQQTVFDAILVRRRDADTTVAEKGAEIAERIVKDLEARPVYRMNLVWEGGKTAAQRDNPRKWFIEALSRSGVIVENLPQRLKDIQTTVDAFRSQTERVGGRPLPDVEFIYDKYDDAGVTIKTMKDGKEVLQLNLHKLLLKEQTFSGSLPVDTILSRVTLLHELYLAAGGAASWEKLAGTQMVEIGGEIQKLAQSYLYFGSGARVEDMAYLVFVADRTGYDGLPEIQALRQKMTQSAEAKIDALTRKYAEETADEKELEKLRRDIWGKMTMYNREIQDAPDRAKLISRSITLEDDLDVIALLSAAGKNGKDIRPGELTALRDISSELYRGTLDRVFNYHPRMQRLYALQNDVAGAGPAVNETVSEIAAFPAEIAGPLKKNYFIPKGYEADGKTFESSASLREDTRRRAGKARPVVFSADGKAIRFSIAVDPRFAAAAPDIDLGAVLQDHFNAFAKLFPKDWYDRLQALEGKEIAIALLDKSQNVFEDHVGDGFIGVNRALFDVYKERKEKLSVILGVGLFHELRHEATGRGADIEEELAEESVRLTMQSLQLNHVRIDILDFLADLQDLYAIESEYIRVFVNMTSIAYASLLIGNTKIFNLFIKYGIDQSVFISDCNPPGIGDGAMNDVSTYFGKMIAKIDHHASDPALRRETATSQMIKFLANNTTAPAMLQDYSYITTHVDPDSMLAYFVLKNWDAIKDRPEMLRLAQEAAYYADFGLLVKQSLDSVFAGKMQLFTNVLFGMQNEINRLPEKETEFRKQCGRILDLADAILDPALRVTNAENPKGMPQPLVPRYGLLLENRFNEVYGMTAQAVRDALARGDLVYDNLTGLMTVDLKDTRGAVYNPNIMAYLKKIDEAYRAGRYTIDAETQAVTVDIEGYGPVQLDKSVQPFLKRTTEPVAVISGRAPPAKAPDGARATYGITLWYKDDYEIEMPSIARVFRRLNEKEPQETKGWGGRDDGGGSSWTKGSALSMGDVRDTVAASIRDYYAQPENYPQFARKIYEEMKTYTGALPRGRQNEILKDVPMEGGRRMLSPDVATIALDGILTMDPRTVEAFTQAVEGKYGDAARNALAARKGVIDRYLQEKDRLPSLSSGDRRLFYTEYGIKLNEMNPALFEKITTGSLDLTAEEKAQMQTLVTEMDLEGIAKKVFGKELKELPEDVRLVIRSPEFLACFIALGLAADSGNTVAFDKRNLFNEEGTGPSPSMDVYMKLLGYVADYCEKENKKTRLVVFDCKKDGKELKDDMVDARLQAVKGIVQVARTGDDVVAEILARLKISENELSLIGHQDNLAYYRQWIGKLVSMLIFRPDGKLVDLSKEELALIEKIDPKTAAGIKAGTVELVPVVTYDSKRFSQQMKAGLALGIAA